MNILDFLCSRGLPSPTLSVRARFSAARVRYSLEKGVTNSLGSLREGGVKVKRARVLVVDDDRLVADTLCLIFRANGFDSEARYSAATGFECAQNYHPSLMLCDVIMPGESGLQLAQRVREALPATQLLMLTAYPSNAAEVQDGAAAFRTSLKLLSKPCRPDDLLRETHALLRSA